MNKREQITKLIGRYSEDCLGVKELIDKLVSLSELESQPDPDSVKKDPLAVDETTPIDTLCWMWDANRKMAALRKLRKYDADGELKFRSDYNNWRYAERAVLFQPRPHSGEEPPEDWKGYGMILKSTGIHVYKDNQSYLGFIWSGVTGYFLPEDMGWEE